MSVLSRESGLFARGLTEYVNATKRRIAIALAEHADRANMGLTPKMYIGGITRPRDLRVIARSTGGQLERLTIDQSLFPDTDTPSVPERVPTYSRDVFKGPVEAVDTTQWPLNNATHVDASLYAHPAPQLSFASQQTRGFHTSSRVPYDSTSYNVTDVPDFFVKYKQHRATSSTDPVVHGRKHEELGLMQSLADSILSGDVVANTRRLQAKIPVEHHVTGGHVVHPSGFVVPGPGHTSTSDVARAKERERNENIDRAVQTAAVAHCVLESDFEQVDATTLPSSHKVPFEVREADGTVKHPSGFVPPTPAHKFRYTVNTSVLRDRKVSAARQKARQPSPARAVLRAMHTASAPQASGDS